MKKGNIDKAKEKVNKLNKLGKEIKKAQPKLNDISFRLDLISDIYSLKNPTRDKFLDPFEPFVESVNNIKIEEFTVTDASGSAGIGATGTSILTGMISQVIGSFDTNEGNYTQQLLNKLYDYNYQRKKNQIIYEELCTLNNKLASQFQHVTDSHDQWTNGLLDSSDLAKDMRNFLEHFKGHLNILRSKKENRGENDVPKFSWNKVAKALSKKGKETYVSLLKQQLFHLNLHTNLSQILKTTEKHNMVYIFNEFIEHIYAVVNLIDSE